MQNGASVHQLHVVLPSGNTLDKTHKRRIQQ